MSNTQSHLIVKEEGICIYREPEPPKKMTDEEWESYLKSIEGFEDIDSYKAFTYRNLCDKTGLEYSKEIEQAQSSAILCEDQERAIEIVAKELSKNHPISPWSLKRKLSTYIGSIYPVPGIEFEEVHGCEKCGAHYSKTEIECRNGYCEKRTVARLIEHTAEKERFTDDEKTMLFTKSEMSKAADPKGYATAAVKILHALKLVIGEHVTEWAMPVLIQIMKNNITLESESPEIDKEEERKTVAKILRDNITFSGQVGDYVIHGAIDKIIEWANTRKP